MQLDGYIRISQVRGRSGERFISPAVQREEIARWISSNGSSLGEMFEELDQSGARPDRPLLMEAIERVESGVSNGIVVAKLNRFGRSILDGLSLIARIQAAGGTLVSVQQGFDLNTPTGQLVSRILFAVAEWELDQWREHWDIARSRAVQRGLYPSRKAPIGYRLTEGGRLEIDPHEGPVIREMFERKLAGANGRELAEFLNGSEIETESGRPFSNCLLYRMIKNPAYKGTAYSGQHNNPDAHEPIIDAASWQKCQYPPRRPRQGVECLVAGKIRCATCGGMMTPSRPNGAKSRSNFYRCWSSKCPTPARARGDELDPLIEEFVFRHSRADQPADGDRRAEKCEVAVSQAESDLAGYRDNVALQRTIGPESFEAGLAKRQTRLERRLLEQARAKRGRRAPSIDLERLESDWADLSWEERRHWVGEILDCVIVEPGESAVIERARVFRRGRGPIISGKARQLESFAARDGARLRPIRLWGESRIEEELGAFLANHDAEWPPYLDFARAGRARLHAQMMAWGGPHFWGHRLGISVPKLHERWTEHRLRGALAPLMAERDWFPRKAEFVAAGMEDVYVAVRDSGGFDFWAEQFGVTYDSAHGSNLWPMERVESELREFVAGRRRFPRKKDFVMAGREKLYRALLTHDGIPFWAARMHFDT